MFRRTTSTAPQLQVVVVVVVVVVATFGRIPQCRRPQHDARAGFVLERAEALGNGNARARGTVWHPNQFIRPPG